MSKISLTTVKNNIKTTVLELICFIKTDIIKDVNIQSDLDFIENLFSIMDHDTLVTHIVKHVLPHEDKISERKTSFFTSKKNRHIFSIVPEEKYAYFSDLIKTGKVNQENISVIFDYFDVLLELSKIINS
jgi:hypothetical protein